MLQVRLLIPVVLALATTLLAAPASAQYRCPPGYMRNRFGRCVPFRSRSCPPGTFLSNGVCIRSRAPQPVVCPRGWFFFRGRCRPR